MDGFSQVVSLLRGSLDIRSSFPAVPTTTQSEADQSDYVGHGQKVEELALRVHFSSEDYILTASTATHGSASSCEINAPSDVFDPWDFIELPGLDSANVHSDLLGVAPAASSPSPSSTPAPAALATPPSEITANAMAAYETG